MPMLYRVDTDEPVGELDDAMLGQLQAALEEESDRDRDYFIDANTLDYLESRGLDPAILAMLRGSIGAEGAEFRWEA